MSIIYLNREALDKPEPERSILQAQFHIMSKRLLYGITLPSAILTFIFGIWLLLYYPSIPVWLYLKLGLVLILFIYHYSLHVIYRQQSKQIFSWTSQQLRLWNEVPTVILVSVVMLVVVRQNISLLYGLLGLFGFVILLMSAIKIYRVLR